jgi:hypothetical protein
VAFDCLWLLLLLLLQCLLRFQAKVLARSQYCCSVLAEQAGFVTPRDVQYQQL